MKFLEKIVRQIAGIPAPKDSETKETRDGDEPQRDRGEKQTEKQEAGGDERPRRSRNDRRGTRKHEKKNQQRRSNQRHNNRGPSQRNQKPRDQKPRDQKPQDQQAEKRPPRPERTPKPASDPIGFRDMGLREEILRAIGEQGYTNPTPIQKAAIAELIAGRDLLGCAQTGTGKTAAFALPTLERLAAHPSQARKTRVLVLTPTRELALQIKESYVEYGRHLDSQTLVVFGGVGIEPQKKALRGRVDILVATPGRLLDLHSQNCIDFSGIDTLVLDEADRMLDMGFLPDVRRILKLLPAKRQNILFSATMPSDIANLSKTLLRDPLTVEVAPVSSASEQVEQSAYLVNRKNKAQLLLHLLANPSTYKVIVFTRTKAIANRVTAMLLKNDISAEAIHGNKSQNVRQRALANFRGEKTRVLIASDLAARGIDVDDITHVINYDVPNIPETYVHRIGRTGRAAAVGKAISFVDAEEQLFLVNIERLIGKKIPIVEDHPFPFEPGEVIPASERVSGQRQRQRRSGRSRPGGQNAPARSGRRPRRRS